MAEKTKITIENVSKRFGALEIMPNLSVKLDAGAFTVILGPSGCGKSTLLNMIAGLEEVSGGRILFGQKEVQDLPAKDRGCAILFQNYALYPHMSVAGNIGYALKLARVEKMQRLERIERVAKVTGLSGMLDRRPSQLSGGQRQRVAIARAIIREPQVMLFDEPLSNLDAQLRHDMRLELIELHQRVGATTVFVTHDQVEAMTLAAKILILNNGTIEQYGTPDEIYHHPATTFVASFIGAPPMNLLNAQGDGRVVRLPNGSSVAETSIKGEVIVGIRPEVIEVDAAGDIELKVRHIEKLGSHAIITAVLAEDTLVRITTPHGMQFDEKNSLRVNFPKDKIQLFDKETGRAFAAPVTGEN